MGNLGEPMKCLTYQMHRLKLLKQTPRILVYPQYNMGKLSLTSEYLGVCELMYIRTFMGNDFHVLKFY